MALRIYYPSKEALLSALAEAGVEVVIDIVLGDSDDEIVSVEAKLHPALAVMLSRLAEFFPIAIYLTAGGEGIVSGEREVEGASVKDTRTGEEAYTTTAEGSPEAEGIETGEVSVMSEGGYHNGVPVMTAEETAELLRQADREIARILFGEEEDEGVDEDVEEDEDVVAEAPAEVEVAEEVEVVEDVEVATKPDEEVAVLEDEDADILPDEDEEVEEEADEEMTEDVDEETEVELDIGSEKPASHIEVLEKNILKFLDEEDF